MQQRTGVGEGGRRIRRTRDDIPVVYYVFDVLYARRLQPDASRSGKAQATARQRSSAQRLVRYSDHYIGNGTALFEAAAQNGLEGIIAKRRRSCYEQRRSSDWLKIKIVKPAGVRYRRLHRSAGGARKLRIRGPRAV